MPPLSHRAPGLTGAVLESDDVIAELVCDGVHVHPAMMRVALAASGEYADFQNVAHGALQTVLAGVPQLGLPLAEAADHILAGSDYPHQIGSIPSMLESLGGLPITESERTAIFGGNAARVYGL
mgnify:CR=1 FL=1